MKLLKMVGTALAVALVVPIAIISLVFYLPMLLLHLVQYLLKRLFRKLRSDPKYPIPPYTTGDNTNPPETIDSLKQLFSTYLDQLNSNTALLSMSEIDITLGTIDKDYDISDDSDFVTLTASVTTSKATAILKMEAMRYTPESTEYLSPEQEYSPFLCISFSGTNGVKSEFSVTDNEDFLFLITSLEGGQTLSPALQIWTRINDNVRMVCYFPVISSGKLKGEYGFRERYSVKKARMYFYD